jgi:hypothetical protein
MNLTEQNIKEKTISELIFHSTYPETLQMDITSEGIIRYIKLNRLHPIYNFNDPKIDTFLKEERYKMRGNDINNYLFNKDLQSIEEIMKVFENIESEIKSNELYFYLFSFSELIELLRIFERLYRLHSRLLKNATKEKTIYDKLEKEFKKHGERIEGEKVHNWNLQNELELEIFEENKLSNYYLENIRKIKIEIYKRLGVGYETRFDIFESQISEYLKAKNLVQMEDLQIKENFPNYTKGLIDLDEMVSEAKLMKRRF